MKGRIIMFLVDLFLERLDELAESIGSFNVLLIVFFGCALLLLFVHWCFKEDCKSSEPNEIEEAQAEDVNNDTE